MSDFQPRQPKGVPAGGQFSTTNRAETGTTLTGSITTGTPDPARTVGELADRLKQYLDEFPHTADTNDLLTELVPHVPNNVADDLWHDAINAHVTGDDDRRTRLLAQMVTWEARESRWKDDSTFTAPTAQVTESGANGPVVYTTAVGSKYTGFRDVADVAKDVRGDLKAAQAAGYLPDDVKMSVTTSKYAGGQALRVEIRGMSDQDIYRHDPTSWEPGRRYSAPCREVIDRVDAIAGAYDRSTTDAQTDYFNVMYWCHVDVEDEAGAQWRAKQTAARRQAR